MLVCLPPVHLDHTAGGVLALRVERTLHIVIRSVRVAHEGTYFDTGLHTVVVHRQCGMGVDHWLDLAWVQSGDARGAYLLWALVLWEDGGCLLVG